MAISSYPSGFSGGVLLKELPLFDVMAGNVFWVDSGSGGSGNPGTFNRPLATLAGAFAKCTANNGDYIVCKPGHTEEITAAGGLAITVAGVTVVGLGNGSAQPQVRFTTATTADIDISAANTMFINMRFTAAFADVAAAIDINAGGSDTVFRSCRFDEETTDENYVIVIDVATAVDGLKLIDCDYVGNDAANDNLVNFAGTHTNTQIVGNRMSHLTAQTSSAPFIASATQQVNMLLQDNVMHSESAAAAAAFVVLTGTTNNGWAINNSISSVDTDATAANFVAGFDVTGLFCKNNHAVSGVADTYAVETFLTAEDLT